MNLSKTCSGCGATFFMQSYDWPKNFEKRQFCGWGCARQHGKKRQPGPVLSKQCVECGKMFFKTHSGSARWSGRKHCSLSCALRGRTVAPRKRKHGRTDDPVYKVWTAMKQRCLNPKSPVWKYYGGRGITVCERWKTFENFASDMGARPAGGTLDRIDNNSGYFPENCRWATRTEQANNIRTNRILTVDGVSKTTRQWESDLGMRRGAIASRVCTLGWTPEEAILTPLKRGNKPHHRVRHVR